MARLDVERLRVVVAAKPVEVPSVTSSVPAREKQWIPTLNGSGLQQKTLAFQVTPVALSLLLLFVWIYKFYIVYLGIYIILKQKPYR